jgi:hypothetical protein
VRALVIPGHQHADIPTDNFSGFVAEQTFRGPVEDLNRTDVIDENDAVHGGVQESFQLLG